MKLKQGQLAPNFDVLDINGNRVNLHNSSNQKILLTFFRYAECALCNLRISEIIKESERLKELNVKLIAVFQSGTDSLKAMRNKHSFNFTIIADPNLDLYDLYAVKPSWSKLIRTTGYKGISSIIKASKNGFKLGGKVEGKFHQIPADFLIDREKRIEIAHYGNNLVDHIPLRMIT